METKRKDRDEEYVLRFAEPADVPEILKLIKELAVYEKMAGRVHASEQNLLESIFVRHRAEVLIAQWKEEVVGFALFFYNYSTFEGVECLYLEDVFVKEAYRGRGIGKSFFGKLAGIALERGCPRLDWICLDWNAQSIAFYKKLGAAAQDAWTIYRLGPDELKEVAEQDGR